MAQEHPVLQRLRADGNRITRARRAAVEIFAKRHIPMSAADVLAALRKRSVAANPATVYRELRFLEREGVLSSVHFKDGIVRYELADLPHHHHLVCTSCNVVADVHMHGDLAAFEKRIARKTGFAVSDHTLEFYGTCRRCR